MNPRTVSRLCFPQTHPFNTRHSFEKKPLFKIRFLQKNTICLLRNFSGGEGVERDIQSLPVGGLNPQTISRFGFPQTHPFSTRHSFEKKPSFKIRFLQKKYDLSAPELFWRRRSRAGKDIIAGGNDVPASVGCTITFLKFATFYCAALRMDFVHSPNFYFGDEQIGFYAKKKHDAFASCFFGGEGGTHSVTPHLKTVHRTVFPVKSKDFTVGSIESLFSDSIKKQPRKIGAVFWRRRRDSNPRASFRPAYALSRGASSPT